MSVTLRLVDPNSDFDLVKLYDLLEEREPHQAISHKEMPTYFQHVEFVKSEPYKAWYLITGYQGRVIGATYLSKQNEIGIGIFKKYQGKGYGRDAVLQLMKKHKGPFLANINPKNAASIAFFEHLDFGLLQVTYEKK